MADKINIDPYRAGDRQRIREISYETAFMGESPVGFFDNKEILADAVTSYYTDYEPESVFVAKCEKKVVGYLTGSINPYRYQRTIFTRIFPKLIWKSVLVLIFLKPKIMKFLYHSMTSFLKGEFKKPCLEEYPAHFHINVVKDYRKMGVGTELIKCYMRYLRDKNVKGVNIVTVSEKAMLFFKKNGFKILSSRISNHLHYLLKRSLAIYTLAKKLE